MNLFFSRRIFLNLFLLGLFLLFILILLFFLFLVLGGLSLVLLIFNSTVGLFWRLGLLFLKVILLLFDWNFFFLLVLLFHFLFDLFLWLGFFIVNFRCVFLGVLWDVRDYNGWIILLFIRHHQVLDLLHSDGALCLLGREFFQLLDTRLTLSALNIIHGSLLLQLHEKLHLLLDAHVYGYLDEIVSL